MCGRFTLKTSVDEWLNDLFPDPQGGSLVCSGKSGDKLHQSDPSFWVPRYNIAPTQSVLTLRIDKTGEFLLEPMRWGLIPSWARTLNTGYSMFNARMESIEEKASFKNLIADHRCVLLADGYYEWKTESGGRKVPYWIHRPAERGFAMAGLWTTNRNISQSCITSATIITVPANLDTKAVHDRMPAIFLDGESIIRWLQPGQTELKTPHWFSEDLPRGSFSLRRVSSAVNNARHEGASLLDAQG